MKEQIVKKNFTRFVNRNYYVGSHLAERLSELSGTALFLRFQNDIIGTISALELQLNQITQLFVILDVVDSITDCEPMIAFLESAFTLIQLQSNDTPFLSLLDYISIADSLMEESSRLATLAISQLPELDLPAYQLYYASTLQTLKASLDEVYLVS